VWYNIHIGGNDMTYEQDYTRQIKKLTNHVNNRVAFKCDATVETTSTLNELNTLSILVPQYSNDKNGRIILNQVLRALRSKVFKI